MSPGPELQLFESNPAGLPMTLRVRPDAYVKAINHTLLGLTPLPFCMDIHIE